MALSSLLIAASPLVDEGLVDTLPRYVRDAELFKDHARAGLL